MSADLWRWESDAHPGLHLEGPQGLIDDAMQIEDADVVVGIFWKRSAPDSEGAQARSTNCGAHGPLGVRTVVPR